MKVYLKSLYRASINMIRNHDTANSEYYFKVLEDKEKYNLDQAAIIFNSLINGDVDCFFKTTKTQKIIIHRSPKQDNYLQISYIWKRTKTELIPTMDKQINNVEDLCKALEHGYYTAFSNKTT